jgi:L-aminopeptidase/D-esterase-like protein
MLDLMPCIASSDTTRGPGMRRCADAGRTDTADEARELGSIIVIVATDAPLLPHQLKRIVNRVSLGIARTGGFGGNGSGDIFLAFSTANAGTGSATGIAKVDMLPNARMNSLFYATVQATEEAIVNAMLAAETMTGADDFRLYAMPRDRLIAALRKYGR